MPNPSFTNENYRCTIRLLLKKLVVVTDIVNEITIAFNTAKTLISSFTK